MHAALRPYVTAGVAIVGASAIAVTPIAPTPPDLNVQSPAVQLAANPFAFYGVVADRTQANIDALLTLAFDPPGVPGQSTDFDLAGLIQNNPLAPLIQGLLDDPEASVQQVGAIIDGLVTALEASGESLPGVLEAVANQLAAGNVQGATNILLLSGAGAVVALASAVATPVVTPLLVQALTNQLIAAGVDPEIAAAQAQAIAPASAQALVASTVLGFGGPLIAGPGAGAAALQGLINAVGSGDPEGFAGALINGPAIVADGFLNGGYGPNLAPLTPYGTIPGATATALAGGLFSPGNLVFNQQTNTIRYDIPGPIATSINLIRTLQLLTNPPEVEEMSALNAPDSASAKTLNTNANEGAQQQGPGPVVEEKKITTDAEETGNVVDVDKVTNNEGAEKKQDRPRLLGGNNGAQVGGGQGFKKLREGIESGFQKAVNDFDHAVKRFTGHGDGGGNAAAANDSE